MSTTASSQILIFPSYSKINLFLHVTGKRADGYHTLQTVFCPLTLSDEIHISFTPNTLTLSADTPEVPADSSNLAFQAADLFFAETEIVPCVSISLKKQIPISAGLGGGSSNAATVLAALNTHFNHPLSQEKLYHLALSLGADVPFFLLGKPAYAEGIGEKLTPLSAVLPYWVLLICPPYGVSTAEVYQKLTFPLTKTEKHLMNSVLKGASFDPIAFLHNDLESVTFKLHPTLQRQKEQLLRLGAAGALMSGSGPTLFGLFRSKEAAEQAKRAWAGDERRFLTQFKL